MLVRFLQRLTNVLNRAKKEAFYRAEYEGAPLAVSMTFRCTRRLKTFLETKGIEEGRDGSAVVRRMLTAQATREGYDVNGG